MPASETEVYNHDGAVTSATTAVSPDAGSTNGMSATHADLAYELPDTAPTITGWQDTTPHVATAGAPTAIGDGGVTVDDHELDTLTTKESGTYSYAGTTLTVQRYADGKAAPSAADSFGVTGTDVSMAGGQVSVNGTAIGTYTDTGGVLNFTFNTAATKASIATLAQDLTYTYTPTATDPATQLDVTLGPRSPMAIPTLRARRSPLARRARGRADQCAHVHACQCGRQFLCHHLCRTQ
ncbi:hypothetical protein RAA17_10470 [Komagataeibacter rhaeticus]|nr:hypothetical protein [Komagataeibacter rhaeticus]